MQFCPEDGTTLVVANRDPLVGRTIGERYRLDARLGRGAMGTVYRALHTRMDKPVAVKLLRAELAGDSEAVERFHREARSASRLDHEHCIRVTDFGQTDDGLLFLVMELLDGESLGAQVARGPLPPPLVAAIGADVASALAHAHEHGVIHRDLKPDNVMLARRGRRSSARTVVKVLDFGLAKIAGETGAASLTRAGSVFGTPEYMAPEQAEGERLDARTDVYSLGVLLYHLSTGQLPFRAPTVIQLLAQHVEEPPDPPRQRRPDLDIPAELEAVILRCLAKRREDRFNDAGAVAAALRPLADATLLDRLLEAPRTAAETTVDAGHVAGGPAACATDDDRGGDARDDEETERVFFGGGDAESSTPSARAIDGTQRRARRSRLIAIVASGALAATLAVAVAAQFEGGRAAPGRAAQQGGPLSEARRLLDAGKLEDAQRVLAGARAAHDGVEVQLLLGECAQRRGNRLGALAHMHRATRLRPDAVEPHVRLASLLREIGQPDAACREAQAALHADPRSAVALAATEPCGGRKP